jgi:hypothetical protein
MFPSFLKLHGKTYDYKIKYSNIVRLFQLPKPDRFVHTIITTTTQSHNQIKRRRYSENECLLSCHISFNFLFSQTTPFLCGEFGTSHSSRPHIISSCCYSNCWRWNDWSRTQYLTRVSHFLSYQETLFQLLLFLWLLIDSFHEMLSSARKMNELKSCHPKYKDRCGKSSWICLKIWHKRKSLFHPKQTSQGTLSTFFLKNFQKLSCIYYHLLNRTLVSSSLVSLLLWGCVVLCCIVQFYWCSSSKVFIESLWWLSLSLGSQFLFCSQTNNTRSVLPFGFLLLILRDSVPLIEPFVSLLLLIFVLEFSLQIRGNWYSRICTCC